MAHYAFVDNGIVTDVIVGKDEGEDAVDWETYYGAVRTSYNAGIGYTFDPDHGTHGAFIPPRPYPSWVLNADTALWDAPTPMPAEGMWSWDEPTLAWVEVA